MHENVHDALQAAEDEGLEPDLKRARLDPADGTGQSLVLPRVFIDTKGKQDSVLQTQNEAFQCLSIPTLPSVHDVLYLA